MKGKPNPELESRPAGAEIEVTPEMIEAGVNLLLDFNVETCDPYRVVREILTLAPRALPGSRLPH